MSKILAALSITLGVMVCQVATAEKCNKTVIPIVTPTYLAYQSRGYYCEGLYTQEVTNTGLQLVGFHSVPSKFSSQQEKAKVQVKYRGEKRLHIRSTRPHQYYRLDASFDSLSFNYDLSLSRAPDIGLKAQELAVRICIQNCDGIEPTLVPASLSRSNGASDNHFLIWQATEDLISLRVSVRDAKSGEVLLDKEYLDDRVLPAWSAPRQNIQYLAEQSKELFVTAFARGLEDGTPDAVSVHLLLP